MIFHNDLSLQNVPVSEDGALTAVVDWECVSAMPLWFSCQFPPLLEGKPSYEEPLKGMYEVGDDGEVVEMYWEHLDNSQRTHLRQLYT